MDTARASVPTSRPASKASGRSDVSRSSAAQLEASEEVLRVTRQQARIAAEKRKLLARQAAQQAQQAAQQAAMQAEMAMQQADLEEQEGIIAAEVEHAQRAYEISGGSQALSTSDRVRAWAAASNPPEEVDDEDPPNEEAPSGPGERRRPMQCLVASGENEGETLMPARGGAVGAAPRAANVDATAADEMAGWRMAGTDAGTNTALADGRLHHEFAAARASPGAASDRLRAELKVASEQPSAGAPSCAPGAAARERSSPTSRHNADGPPLSSEGSSNELLQQVCQSLTVFHANANFKDLPRFSGDIMEWVSFYGIYQHSTEVGKISDSMNLLRLQRSLSGPAREAVSSLLYSAANVSQIIRTLESLFGDCDEVAYRTMREAKEFAKLGEELNCRDLLRYSCKVNNLITTLRSLGRGGHLANPELLASLVGKLPRTLVAAWAVHDKGAADSDTMLDCFSGWLGASLQRMKSAGVAKLDVRADECRGPRPGGRSIRAAGASDHRRPVFNITDRGCLCCKGAHGLYQCEKFAGMDIEARWSVVKNNNACYLCLLVGHNKFNCRSQQRFPTRRYHPLLTKTKPQKTEPLASERKNDEHSPTARAGPESESGHKINPGRAFVAHASSASLALLKVLPATIRGPKGEVEVFCLLDDGSSLTLLEQEVADKVGLHGRQRSLDLQGIGQMSMSERRSQAVACRIKGVGAKRSFDLTANTVKTLNLPELRTVPPEYVRKYDHLRALACQGVTARPQLIIGQDNWPLIISRGIVKRPGCDIALSRTRLGYVPLGRIATAQENALATSYHVRSAVDDGLHELVRRGIEVDGLEIKGGDSPQTSDEEHASELLTQTTVYEGDRWRTGLLWRQENISLPTAASENTALKRLKALEQKMDSSAAFAEAYCAKMQYYIDQGYVAAVDRAEFIDRPRAWFLPHFPVINPRKPDKVRIVFDCRAVSKGVSLNQHLLIGPDLYNSLVGIIFRFREGRVAFVADIQDMYMRVAVREEDSYSQMFLFRGMDRFSSPTIYRVGTLVFGARCAGACAQYVKNAHAQQYKIQCPAAVQALQQSCYMDDVLGVADNDDQARSVISDLVRICKEGGFKLTKWAASSEGALKDVPQSERSSESVRLETEDISLNKVLGLQYDPKGDAFYFKVGIIQLPEELTSAQEWPTKRQVLRVAMSIFDPAGFISPLIAKAKMLLQEIWRTQIGWDELICEPQYRRWVRWLHLLKEANSVRIPRYYGKPAGQVTSRQLHIFVDVSAEGLCAVAYVRQKDERGEVWVSFVASRTRVAPLKSLTIPRLELNAALLGVKLARKIEQEHVLKFDRMVWWSDSSNVIHWLTTGKDSYQTYVSHRIAAILEFSRPQDWHWVSGKVNVADEGTRSAPGIDLTPNGRWFCGPAFLRRSEEEWPSESSIDIDVGDEVALEKKPGVILTTMEAPRPLICIDRFSNYNRLVRAVAYAVKFTKRCRKQQCANDLTAAELERAEEILLQDAQKRHYRSEIDNLARTQPLHKSSKIFALTPVLNRNGMVCVGGRTAAAPGVPLSVTYPIILSDKDPLTALIIAQFHARANHAGVEHVLNETRTKYWIINGRQAVKRVLRNCRRCSNERVRPQNPRMGNLPAERLDHHQRPFTNTGVDFFGAFSVSVGRRKELRYGVLFTCLSCRAVHLELADSLTTDSAILALRRFVARRGTPRVMYSDNGSNLRGMAAELKRAMTEADQSAWADALAVRGIQWKFVPPLSPEKAGAWERLVRSVKTALSAVLKERAPRPEVLHTLLLEAELVINNRPLTHVSMDARDEAPLTPQHLLTGYRCDNPPAGPFNEEDLSSRKQWRIAQYLSDAFWNSWVRAYLPTLTKRQKWHADVKPLEVGDVVIICDGTLARSCWPKARITKIYPDRDGRVRVVDVQIGSKIYRRSSTKLAKLEVNADST